MKRLFYPLTAALVTIMAMMSCSIEDNANPQPVNPEEVKPDTARHTIIYYGTVGGNSDDQSETAWQIMQPFLKKKDVRVIVCYKYAKPEYFNGKFAKPGDLVLFELTDTTDLNKIGENYAVNWPEFGLYDENILTEIINIAAEKAPAHNYSMLLYGHGGGFDKNVDYEKDLRKPEPKTNGTNRAVLYDEWIENIAGHEAMNMYEFMRGIINSKVEHFQSIFFHNCLMGGVETVLDIAPFCDYTVVSSHLLAMNQSPITQFIQAITEQEDIEKVYLQMLDRMGPQWESGYKGYQFNGDMKLIKSDKIFDLVEPGEKLANRLIELYPTMQQQLDTAMVKTYQYFNQKDFYDLSDYAHKVAEYTQDSQLTSIAAEIDEVLDKAILGRCEQHHSIYGDLPKFTLSVELCNQESYQSKTIWNYTFKEAYEYTNWHIFTGWGNWLNTTKQGPHNQSKSFMGQPVGQFMIEAD